MIGTKQVQLVCPVMHAVVVPVFGSRTTQLLLVSQQSLVILHDCPSCAHVPAPPQVPYVWPGENTQVAPLQQSAVEVHIPLIATQEVAPQWRRPLASGTHGRPLQQSPANAQVSPLMWHAPRP